MAVRRGDRYQVEMFPKSLDEQVDEADPVRVYDRFVDCLELETLGLKVKENAEGNPVYDPSSMLKLILYGYSYGIRSSRRLERAVYHNIQFMWLMGGLKPDHKTISLFRQRNKTTLKNVFKRCVQLCIKLGAVKGNTLIVDGTKMRANAGNKQQFSRPQARQKVDELNRRISKMLNECDRVDLTECNDDSWVKLPENLSTLQKQKEAIETALNELKEEEKSFNLVDPDCKIMASRQGSHAGYSVQLVTDEQDGLIVSHDVTNALNDQGQLGIQLHHAQENTGILPRYAVADKGYSKREDCFAVEHSGIQVITPPIDYAPRSEQSHQFSQRHFFYDTKQDAYRCPEGHRLPCFKIDRNRVRSYRIETAKLCLDCPQFNRCTTSQKGRTITRKPSQEQADSLSARFHSDLGQSLYRKRGQRAEVPFGHLKRNLGVSSFLLRRFEGANAEMAVLSTCYNLSRLISLLTPTQLLSRLATP